MPGGEGDVEASISMVHSSGVPNHFLLLPVPAHLPNMYICVYLSVVFHFVEHAILFYHLPGRDCPSNMK